LIHFHLANPVLKRAGDLLVQLHGTLAHVSIAEILAALADRQGLSAELSAVRHWNGRAPAFVMQNLRAVVGSAVEARPETFVGGLHGGRETYVVPLDPDVETFAN
jgi:hypothetical protein